MTKQVSRVGQVAFDGIGIMLQLGSLSLPATTEIGNFLRPVVTTCGSLRQNNVKIDFLVALYHVSSHSIPCAASVVTESYIGNDRLVFQNVARIAGSTTNVRIIT